MKCIVFYIFILFVGSCCADIPEFSISGSYMGEGNHTYVVDNPYEVIGVVSHIIDGDTFDVIIDDSRDSRITSDKIRVRLADINAPEIRGNDSRAGKESLNFTKNMLLYKTVYLDIDNKKGMDKYNRWVVVCYIGNDNFNKMMVDSGFAEISNYKDNEFDPRTW